MLANTVDYALAERERADRVRRFFNDPEGWLNYMVGASLWSKQREVAQSLVVNKNIAVKAAHGVGKLVAQDTPLPTPTGWVLAGAAKVGDTLLDELGQPTKITGKSPVWDQEKYTITFDDGSTIEAGERHEWNVLDLTKRAKGVKDWRDHWDSTVTLETQELYNQGLKTANGQNRWRIPLAQPLQLPHADLPIDPYVLGAWLGDGTSSKGSLTLGYAKAGIIDKLPANKVTDVPAKNSLEVRVVGLTAQLRELGVLNNKHIPMAYLRASESQRRALLAGIMDTDGFMLHSNSVGIDMTNKKLSEGIYELLMTLGVKVFWSEGVAAYTLDGKRHVTGTRYRMNWTPLENPFCVRGNEWLPPTTQRSRHTQRTIVAIEKTGRVANYCIEVDSPRHLYLAGKQMVPTHNSFLAAVLVCWWVDTRYPKVFVASTAPSVAQINAIVWREIRLMKDLIEQRHNKGLIDHKLPGYITSDAQWKTENGTLIGFGRKPPDEDVDAFQGIHAEHVLAIGDEAVGLPESLIDSLGNITTNANSRRLLICNPTNPISYVGKIFREDMSNWAKHTISVFDSPNYTGEKMPKEALDSLTDANYAEDRAIEYGGTDKPMYLARVLGEFAFDSTLSLITSADVETAYDVDIMPGAESRPVLGVDVARFGSDSSVVYCNHDGHVRLFDHWQGVDGMISAERIHAAALRTGAAVVNIDGGGLGGPIGDQVARLANGNYQVVQLLGQAASPDNFQWHNARAYWWDSVKKNLRQGKIDLDINDKKLIEELLAVEYKFTPKGALLIESKDDMRKRGMKSPDFADAFIYSLCDTTVLTEDPLATADKGDYFYVDMGYTPIDLIGW